MAGALSLIDNYEDEDRVAQAGPQGALSIPTSAPPGSSASASPPPNDVIEGERQHFLSALPPRMSAPAYQFLDYMTGQQANLARAQDAARQHVEQQMQSDPAHMIGEALGHSVALIGSGNSALMEQGQAMLTALEPTFRRGTYFSPATGQVEQLPGQVWAELQSTQAKLGKMFGPNGFQFAPGIAEENARQAGLSAAAQVPAQAELARLNAQTDVQKGVAERRYGPQVRAANTKTEDMGGPDILGGGYSAAPGQTPTKPAMNISDAILQQESGGRPNVGTSTAGAVGIGQLMPSTFAQYAKPGESINNPADNAAVSKRIIDDLSQKYGGDAARIAVGYFSGPGNIAPPGSPTPWLHDIRDSNGKTTSSYVSDILAAQSGAPAASSPIKAPKPLTPASSDDEIMSQIPRVSAPGPQSTATVRYGLMPQEEKQQQLDVEKSQAIDDAATKAIVVRGNIQGVLNAMSKGTVSTDMSEPARQTAAGWLYAALPENFPDKAKLIQKYTGVNVNDATIAGNQLQRMGMEYGRATEGARPGIGGFEMALKSMPNLSMSGDALKAILQTMLQSSNRAIDQQKMKQAWQAQNQSLYGFDNFFNQMRPAEQYLSRAQPFAMPGRGTEPQPGITYRTSKGLGRYLGDGQFDGVEQ